MINCPNCNAPLPKLLLKVQDVGKLLGESRRRVSDRLKNFEMKWRPMGTGWKHKRVPIWEVERWINSRMVGSKEELRQALDGRRKQ